MNSIKKMFWFLVYTYQYRMIDPDVCCCGDSFCASDWDNHSYRSAKEYAITSAVEKRVK